jgi:TolB protein
MRTSTTLILATILALLFSAVPASATFPGENGKIVFVGNQSGTWQLYTINADGTGITQITNLPPTQWELWLPTFSPDGRRILFSHDTPEKPCQTNPPEGCIDLYVINADGTGLVRLTNDGLSWFGKWSPDGSRIVLNHVLTSTNVNIVTTMPSDGAGKGMALTSEFWDSGGAIYTPNGTHIVFYSQNGGFVSTTWIMDADATNQKRLTPAPLEGYPVDVSPDGRHILLASGGNTPYPSSLFVMDTDGKDIRKLTYIGTDSDFFSSYSPDGKKIVFISRPLSSDNSLDLFTMNADGSDVKRIVSGIAVGACPDGNCIDPSWGSKPKD